MPTAYISHAACHEHAMGPGHPEQPARLDAIRDQLRARGLLDLLVKLEAPPVTEAQLARVHTSAHIQRLRALAPASGLVEIDADTRMGPGTWEAALRAAGAAVMATDRVLSGVLDRAFCAIRPPGHHAEADRAMGFCFFNNIAIAAAHALAAHGLARVAIIDFDVHFGNGTVEIFADEPRVLSCSTYQYPLYPGMNPPTLPGHEINCPLPAGSGGAELRRAVTDHWLPALDAFRPQLLFISAGFDAAAGDPLAGLNFLPADFAWVTGKLCEVAARHGNGRVVSSLEGGYDLTELANCAVAHVEALMSGG